jgi:hypothetical protein
MNLSRPILTCFAGLLACAAASVTAQQTGPDDLYEYTMSMEMEGMSMPAMKQTVCSPKGARDEERVPMEKGCRMLESRRAGTKTFVKAVCEDGADRTTMAMEMESTGKDVFRVKTTAEGVRDGRKFAMKSDMAGKRIGGCKAGEPSKEFAQAEAQMNAAIAKECDKGIETLEAAMFTAVEGVNLPPEAMACRGRKAEFCERVSKLNAGLVTPDAWYAMRERHSSRWATATKACGTDPLKVVGPLCAGEVSKKNWRFVGDACAAEAKALVAQRCAGRTADTVAKGDIDMCSALGGLAYTATDRSADKVGTPATADSATEPAKPKSTTDKLKEGADKLKKFLKF